MIPNVSDSDPDPTSQIPWPAARPRQAASSEASTEVTVDELPSDNKKDSLDGKRRLTTWDLVTLSVSMAGAQVAWTVELGYVASSTLFYMHLTRLVTERRSY
jgi:solute carrier family 45 protein 1/2/4